MYNKTKERDIMKKFLIVVDMQNDFINGALGTREAEAILPNVVNKIKKFDGEIIATFDTHFENYMQTNEGANLPVPHCIKGTLGWELNKEVLNALEEKGYTSLEKLTFGSKELPSLIKEKAKDEPFSVELIGLCTDICVVSNALLLKANFPEIDISVDEKCCAGVTPETHSAAITTMKMCQIKIN